ncbi:class II aldolase/adducin family protein [Microbacterium alcoholitolerans]|uniref:class II aldolase/adducin family protein n=1 Tax=unclassified Microbacterium TaxID=2609290 RepID=UPI003D184BD6
MTDARDQIARVAHSVHARRLTHGRTGNLAVRDGGRILVTPTGVSLGEIEREQLSVLGPDGTHLDGPAPTKEAFLHVAMLRARPDLRAVVHTHSVYSAALSCLAELDEEDPLPPLTAYYGMRIGRLTVLPYFAPGDPAATAAVSTAAECSHALLLRNHGPVVAGADLDSALDALEELEHTAQVHFITSGHRTAPLTPDMLAAFATRVAEGRTPRP